MRHCAGSPYLLPFRGAFRDRSTAVLDNYANGAGGHMPFANEIPAPYPEPPPKVVTEPHVANTLLLSVTADRLLSQCWSKACAVASNFGMHSISIEVLLLAATHIRGAESVLLDACPDVEDLNHALATRCARRSFTEDVVEPQTFMPDKTLKGILGLATALAAEHEVEKLTLSMVLKAIARQRPRLHVVDVLPRLQLQELDSPRSSGAAHANGAQAEEGYELPLFSVRKDKDPVLESIQRLERDVDIIKGNLLYYPSGPADPDIYVSPSLAIPTSQDFSNALRELPSRLVPLIVDAVMDETERRQKPAQGKLNSQRPWWKRLLKR